MRVVVDGIFFQLAQTGIAKLWTSLLKDLGRRSDAEIILLDRGNCPDLTNIRSIPFPRYSEAFSADDSALLQLMCEHFRADAFMSTYYTTPLRVPTVQIVYDMIPEVLGFDMSARMWLEKEIAFSFARKFVAISYNTKNDLIKYYPELSSEMVHVAYPGCDPEIFRRASDEMVLYFKKKHRIRTQYLITVGKRLQHRNYKNTNLLFETLIQEEMNEFDILCVGGEPDVADNILSRLPQDVGVRRVDLSDEELSIAYSGASALIYPSRYEGFGLPVIEAAACGCPIITTNRGSLGEITKMIEAIIVDPDSHADMSDALRRVIDIDYRSFAAEVGQTRASKFDWGIFGNEIWRTLADVVAAARRGEFETFFSDWNSLRTMQSEVDVLRLK